jgi:hypothetical protein
MTHRMKHLDQLQHKGCCGALRTTRGEDGE